MRNLLAREVGRRKDWTEKTSTDLARRFDVIRVEDLNIRGMTRSAKGTREAPGRNVAAKAGLNREIARSLSVSEETVKSHVSSILAKLGLADRTQAAIFALQRHLVPLDEALG